MKVECPEEVNLKLDFESLKLSYKGACRVIRLSLLAALLFPMDSFSHECPKTNDSYEVKVHWDASREVFLGKVLSGIYQSERKPKYNYRVRVDKVFKGVMKEGIIDFKASWRSYGLTLGDNFVFFLVEGATEGCTLVLPFEYHWEERNDISEAKYVREILAFEKASRVDSE